MKFSSLFVLVQEKEEEVLNMTKTLPGQTKAQKQLKRLSTIFYNCSSWQTEELHPSLQASHKKSNFQP